MDFVGAIAYMIYTDCMSYFIGTRLVLFNTQALLTGFVYALPFVSLVSTLFIIFYVIRRNPNKWLGFIIYCFLVIFTWGLIIPSAFQFGTLLNRNTPEDSVSYLSPGYFRSTPKGTYYFNSIDENNRASGLVIKNGKVETFEDMDIFEIFPKTDDSSHMHDPLLDSELNESPVMNLSFGIFHTFIEKGRIAYSQGGISILAFLSLALTLASVYCFSKFSKWRLCNCSIVLAAFTIIALINYGVYSSDLTVKLIAFLNRKDLSIIADRHIIQIGINLCLLISNVIIGIVKAATNPSANSEVQE